MKKRAVIWFSGLFLGAVLACAIAGKDVQESLAIASKAAAVAVTREGAIPSIPWMDEIVK